MKRTYAARSRPATTPARTSTAHLAPWSASPPLGPAPLLLTTSFDSVVLAQDSQPSLSWTSPASEKCVQVSSTGQMGFSAAASAVRLPGRVGCDAAAKKVLRRSASAASPMGVISVRARCRQQPITR